MALGDFTLTNAALTTATIISFTFNNDPAITHSADLVSFGAGASETGSPVTLPTPVDIPPLTFLEFNTQYFTATLVNGFYTGTITVNATRLGNPETVSVNNLVEVYSVAPPPPDPDPNYAINTDPPGVTQISEGSTVNFRVTTLGVATGTVLYWTTVLQGGASVADFADGQLQGTVTIDSIGEGVISRPIAIDAVDDPGENFYLELRVIDFAGTITAYSPPVIILTPYVPPPYDGGGSYDFGGDSPSAPSDSCSPGFDSNSNSCTADGAGGGDKIICTAMNDHYGFGSFRNAIWLAYADRHLTKAHEVGYHTIFLPLVKFGFKQGNGRLNLLVRSILEWGTRHRAIDLRAEMRGGRRDLQGRIIRMIFEPLCYIVGKLKGY